ncbi:ABC transporter ATP-binding protein [Halosegnis marinus]|uniref:ABC transporter ATP-binding protein n=1 Tax=Halosegnis marinus TaxID=3034023 RepID=UPI00360A8AD4
MTRFDSGETPRLEVDSLTKRYGEVTAVDGLSFQVGPGEVFGFLGPNGAGKSTTIDILLDFVRPTSGSVRVCGHDPETAPRAVRRRVGVLPEATGYYERASAREHLRFAAEMKDADPTPERKLERVGLGDAVDRPVGGFSKGMRQRLGLAMALVGRPDLLVLDEPLAGLDPAGARRVRTLVREERDRGRPYCSRVTSPSRSRPSVTGWAFCPRANSSSSTPSPASGSGWTPTVRSS